MSILIKNIFTGSQDSGQGNERAIWGYQDFSAGQITSNSVTITENENGVNAPFSVSKLINYAIIVRSDNEKKYVYSGSVSLFSTKIKVGSFTSNVATLSGVPHSSYPVRIYYKISSNYYPTNYDAPLNTLSPYLLDELDPLLANQEELNNKEPVITAGTTDQYYRGDKTFQTLNGAAVGLSQVDNTSDATKNIATAILTNKTIDSNDNTILNITNSNINSGANIDVSKIGTGIISNVEFNHLDNISSNIQTQFNNKEPVITAGTTDQYYRGDKTFQTLNKSAIGLDNVQNVNTTVASNINYNNGSSGLSSNNVQSAIDEAVSLISDLPAGTIIFYTASTIPSGYLLANGASISKTTYADLYTVYGNKYGETATNFTIPDLLSYGNSYGMFVRAGILSNVGRVQNDQIKAHSHQISSVNWSNDGGSAKVFKRGKNNTSSSDPFDTDNNGSQVETRPKSFTALALIKY